MSTYESEPVTTRVSETIVTDRPLSRRHVDSHYDRGDVSGLDVMAFVVVLIMILGPMAAGAFGLGA